MKQDNKNQKSSSDKNAAATTTDADIKKVPDQAQDVGSSENKGWAGGGMKPNKENDDLTGVELAQKQALESTSNPIRDQDQ